MKKITLMLIMAVCSLMVQAADYPYLVFTNTSGGTTLVNVSNLVLTISGTTLQATGDEGTVSFSLSELASMEFSIDGTTSALENVLNAESEVEVYSISGQHIGRFESLLKAASKLNKGTYVITDGINSQKIEVQ